MHCPSGYFNTMQGQIGDADSNFYLRLQEQGDDTCSQWYKWVATGWKIVAPYKSEILEKHFNKENKE